MSKTKAIHFNNKPGIFRNPRLTLNANDLEYRESHKYLGLIWDKKLSWIPHIKKLADSTRHPSI